MRIFLLLCLLASDSLPMPPPHIEHITVPNSALARARTKADLIVELRASIWEDHENIYNPKREAKIQELAKQLRKEQ